MNVQVIEKNGQPEWAVIPYTEYEHLIEVMETLEDIRAFDETKQRITEGEELVPSTVTYAILDGGNPIRIWRDYRGLTQQQLADKVGISKPYLSQLETGKRTGTTEVLSTLARALNLTLEDLVT